MRTCATHSYLHTCAYVLCSPVCAMHIHMLSPVHICTCMPHTYVLTHMYVLYCMYTILPPLLVLGPLDMFLALASPLTLFLPIPALECLVWKPHTHVMALACLTCSLLLEDMPSSCSPLVSISLFLTLASVHTPWPTQRFRSPTVLAIATRYQGLQVVSYRKSSSTLGLVSELGVLFGLKQRLCLSASRCPSSLHCSYIQALQSCLSHAALSSEGLPSLL